MLVDGIFGFTGKYKFLSNFYPSIVGYGGLQYPTVEHAYQAAKTLNPEQRETIRLAATPAMAKRLGRTVHMRHDWESVKVQNMRFLLMQKFVGYHDLSRRLYETGDVYLEETNTWGDTFWGVCKDKGHNVLGNLLMEIRRDIKMLYEPG